MKRSQERKLSMLEVVYLLLLNTRTEILDKMPLITDAITALGTNIDAILTIGQSQGLNRKGIKNNKEVLRRILVQQATEVARKVMGFAANTNNYILLKEVKYSKGALDRQADNVLLIIANIIYDKAVEHKVELADYGIDDAGLVLFRKAIDNFDTSIPKPRTGIVDRHNATVQLMELFETTDELLTNKIDLLVGIVKDSEPVFFRDYDTSRKIIQPARVTLAARIKVVDTNGQPIPLVKATTPGTGKTYTTKAKGSFYIKSIHEGTYKYTFSKEGYTSTEARIIIVKGERTDVTITLKESQP